MNRLAARSRAGLAVQLLAVFAVLLMLAIGVLVGLLAALYAVGWVVNLLGPRSS